MPDLSPHRQFDLTGGSVFVYPRPVAEQVAADRIAAEIRSRVAAKGRAVLGLATGSTPIAVYDRLAAAHEAGELSFDGVITYNLDEYYPMSPADPASYRAFMDLHLFRRVRLPANRSHLLDGTIAEAHAEDHARQFDGWVAADGGLDFQLLGLGRNGHIGFNEPAELDLAAALNLPTRLVDLHETTRADAVKDFPEAAAVPRQALTMGIATILAARSILVLAFGAGKADAVKRSLIGPMGSQVPGSLLQSAGPRVTWLLDEEAAAGLP